MERLGQGINLDLSLDDFIPPHLQKKPTQGPEQRSVNDTETPEQHYSAQSLQYYSSTNESPPEDQCEIPTRKRIWIRYDGIGPTDESGMPYASRSSVDKPREWYKNMFKVLHRLSDSENSESENEDLEIPDRQRKGPTTTITSTFQDDLQVIPHRLKDESMITSSAPSELQRTLNYPSDHHQRTLHFNPAQPHKTRNNFPTEQDSFASNVSNKLHSYPKSSPASNQSPEVQLNVRLSPKMPNSTSQTLPEISQKSNAFSKERPFALNGDTNQPQRKLEQTPRFVQTSFEHKSLDYYPVSTNSMFEFTSKTPSPLQNASITNQHLSSGSISEETCPSPSSNNARHFRRSTSLVLDQLEAELREFTEELDRDEQVHKDISGNILNHNMEATIKRSSSKPASPGGPRDEVDRSGPQNHNDLKEISKAIVKFNFEAQSPKELSVQKGNTVSILKRVDKNWLLGELNGQRGRFPDKYVEILPPGRSAPKPTCRLSGISLYDFTADSDAELSLRKGERVFITRRVGGNWFEGQVDGSSRIGLFPASYVQVTREPTQEQKGTPRITGIAKSNSLEQATHRESASVRKPSLTTKRPEVPGTQYRVLFDFTPNNFDELHLIAGDMVTVTQLCEDGWYVGVCWRTQEFGTFPGNFAVPQPMT